MSQEMADTQAATGCGNDSIKLPASAGAAQHGRVPAWQAYGQTIWQFDFEPSSRPPTYEVKLRDLPGLGLALSTSSASRVRRGSHHLINDDLVLRINLAGCRTLLQRGREAVVGPGEGVLSSGAEISAAVTTESRFLSFRVPLKPIKALVPDVEDRLARTIPRANKSLPMLVRYGDMLLDAAAAVPPELQQLTATHVHDLIALTLGAVGEPAATATLRGARAARLAEIKADVDVRLGDVDLSIAIMAEHHRLPVRYVQRLFEADGRTFTDFLLERRLARVHRMLSDPRAASRPIGLIAFEAGFHNQAYFNRTFRSRYGAAPSDIRAQVRRDH